MTVSISEIRGLVRSMGEKINAPSALLSIPSQSPGNGTPHMEVDDNNYMYVVSERGEEFSRQITTDLDELLYWIFDSVTFSMAVKYEIDHRAGGEGPRRVIFSKQLEILAFLKAEWAVLAKKNIDEIIKNHPYSDAP